MLPALPSPPVSRFPRINAQAIAFWAAAKEADQALDTAGEVADGLRRLRESRLNVATGGEDDKRRGAPPARLGSQP